MRDQVMPADRQLEMDTFKIMYTVTISQMWSKIGYDSKLEY